MDDYMDTLLIFHHPQNNKFKFYYRTNAFKNTDRFQIMSTPCQSHLFHLIREL